MKITTMLTKKRNWKTTEGINVRISRGTFRLLKKYTIENNNGLSVFVDDAVVEKIKRDSESKQKKDDVRA